MRTRLEPWLAISALVAIISLVACNCVHNRPSDYEIQAAELNYQSGLKNLYAGKYDEAIKDFKRAIGYYDRDAMFFNGLGLAYQAQGYFEIAIRHYQQALKINKEIPDIYNNLGSAFLEVGKYDDAIYNLKVALDNPKYKARAPAYYNLGMAYMGRDEILKAKEAFQKAIETEPDFYRPYVRIAQIQFDQGLNHLAMNSIKDAETLGEDRPLALFDIAEFYEYINQPDMAKEYYLKLFRSYPQHPLAEKAKQKLRQ